MSLLTLYFFLFFYLMLWCSSFESQLAQFLPSIMVAIQFYKAESLYLMMSQQFKLQSAGIIQLLT